MSETTIQESLLQFFRDQFDIELPSTSTDLIDAGILDSLMVIEVVVFIEEQYSVTTQLDDLDLDNFVTIENMARFVAARQQPADPGDLDGEQAASTEFSERSTSKEGA